MKKMFLTALVALPALLMAQGGAYTLNGKIGTLNAPAKAYLSSRVDGKNVMDSADIKGGAFKFTGTVADVTRANLTIDHSGVGIKALMRVADAKAVYLEKGTISITSKDSVKNGVISGSAINKESDIYMKLFAVTDKGMADINAEFAQASPEKKKDAMFMKDLRERYSKQEDAKKEIQKKYIAQNPKSYFSLVALKDIAGSNMDVVVIDPMFKGLSESLRKSADGLAFSKLIEGNRMTAMGAMAPEFTQNDVNDKPVKLTDFRGKYVLLDFWASWCGPCRGENPNVVKAFNAYKDKNFTILGISLDQPGAKDKWLKAIKDDGLEWTQVSDLKFWDNEVAKLYAVRGIPQNFLLDPTGKIVGKNLRGEELEKKLAEVIK